MREPALDAVRACASDETRRFSLKEFESHLNIVPSEAWREACEGAHSNEPL